MAALSQAFGLGVIVGIAIPLGLVYVALLGINFLLECLIEFLRYLGD